MAQAPRFSVIIPFYNEAAHIRGALESVAGQDVETEEIETVIIDDCSENAEYEKLHHLAESIDLNIRIFRQSENKGPGHARNRGFRESRGSYLAFLDADDRLHSHKLSVQAGALEQYGGDAVVSDYQQKKEGEELHTVRFGWALQSGDAFHSALAIRCGIQLGAMLMKREMVERMQGFRTMRLGQDKDFFLRSVIAGNRWVYQPGTVSEYTMREESISSGELNYLKKVSRRHILLLALKELQRRDKLDNAAAKVLADKLSIEARRWAAYGYWQCAGERYRLARTLDPGITPRGTRFYQLSHRVLGFLPAEKLRYFLCTITGRAT